MITTLYRQIGQYRRAALLTPLWTSLEVVMDVLIPYATAMLIDRGVTAGDVSQVYRYGLLMVFMAFMSLAFGILAGRSSAYASTGFASNLRRAMYRNVQTFAFSNIDKFSTPGLVTRMTTDVNNLQNAIQPSSSSSLASCSSFRPSRSSSSIRRTPRLFRNTSMAGRRCRRASR